MRISLVGATGLIGRQFLAKALETDRIEKVVAFTRRPLSITHPKLEVRVVDFDQLLQDPNAAGKDWGTTVVICLGTTLKKAGSQDAFRKVDHDYVVACAKAAQKSGCQSILLVTATGANEKSGIFYNRTKGETERDVAALRFSSTHFFRPSLLEGEREESRPGEKWAQRLAPLYNLLLIGPFKRYRSVDSGQVAEALLKTCLNSAPGTHFHESEEFHS